MKGLIITCLFILISVSLGYADCDMMAMLAKEGYQISQYNTLANEFFQFQKARSCQAHQNDGYGVIYYKNNSYTIPYNRTHPFDPDNQAFYLIGPKNSSWYGCHGPDAFGKYYNDSNHPDGPNYNWIGLDNPIQVEFTHNDTATVLMLIGFSFPFYGINYTSFRINPNEWISFADDNNQWNNTDVYNNDPDWFEIHPLNWVCLGNNHNLVETVGDTELSFHYIMSRIIEYEGDVVNGMISALNETDLEGYNFRDSLLAESIEVNIVLSDGETLYVFRNFTGYNLSYKEYDGLNEGFVGVKTQGTINGGIQVQQYSLVEIPREGEIVTYENILTDAKSYSFDPTSEPGWTWLSFDILNTDSNENLAQNLLDPIKDEDYLDYALFKDHGNNTSIETIKYLGVLGWQNGDHPITSPYGYKFRTFDDCHLTVLGERCSENTTFYLAGEEEENWIGYFLLETQHVYDAFAGQLDNLTEIKAQHWAVKKGNGWPDVPYTLSSGDMIIVKCERDIPEFSWNFEETREKYIVSGSQDFTFEEEVDYIPVFIELDPNDLPSEIGAYVEGECKGATVVQDTSAQICTYILENQGQNLTFEFSYGSREQNKRIEKYIIYDPETSKTEKGSIQIDTHKDCYYVSFKGNQNETPALISIEITNYPNPFNPETRLTFSLPNEQKIELTIYNIKGQKVKQLIKGQLAAGQHSTLWEGKDDNGKSVGSGLYFYKLKTGDKVISKKMLLLK